MKSTVRIIRRIMGFLPLHLIKNHIKYNTLSLVFWVLLFAIVSDNFGYAFGIPLLFFSPEYLGTTSMLSFLITGFAVGGFIMAFNTYSYMRLSPRYPFFATVFRPFFKFTKNNFIIPVTFIVYYLVKMVQFQLKNESASHLEILGYSIAFLGGISIFYGISLIYFFPTSPKHIELTTDDEDNDEETMEELTIKSLFFNKRTQVKVLDRAKTRKFYYINKYLQIVKSRPVNHIDQHILEQVYAKNRVNAVIFESITILSFITLGFFRDYRLFELPAAASIVLLFTIILLFTSAFMSWFGRWTYIIVIGIFVLFNVLSHTSPRFAYRSYAYGLNYWGANQPEYSVKAIEQNANKDTKPHYNAYLETLNNWKQKTKKQKPKLIIINTTGGGSRSALWTFEVLRRVDSLTQGDFTKQIHLITGASGGMIGASYFRELLLQSNTKMISDLHEPIYRDNMGKDLLNKLSFAASTNDLFLRYQKMEYNGMHYTKDRGTAFEEQLHLNTGGVLDKHLGYYTPFEQEGVIPTMIFSPTIVNDGRRLLIASQSVHFLTQHQNDNSSIKQSNENIDFMTYFAGHHPEDVRFSSVLRSSATFPFILPMMSMPTQPNMQLMDAGIRDNYGTKTTMLFLQQFKSWIANNTSGVLIIQIRDTKKVLDDESYDQITLADKFSLPFGNMYANFPRTQDFDQEELMTMGAKQFSFPVDLISFNLRQSSKDRISLSWHLTKNERKKIIDAFNLPVNMRAYQYVKQAIK